MTTVRDLERLMSLLHRATVDLEAENIKLEDEKKAAVPASVRRKIRDIERKHRTTLEALAKKVEELTAQLKEETLEYGESYKGEHYHSIWNKGRDTWDTNGLLGYSKARPEILEFVKTSEPYISLKRLT